MALDWVQEHARGLDLQKKNTDLSTKLSEAKRKATQAEGSARSAEGRAEQANKRAKEVDAELERAGVRVSELEGEVRELQERLNQVTLETSEAQARAEDERKAKESALRDLVIARTDAVEKYKDSEEYQDDVSAAAFEFFTDGFSDAVARIRLQCRCSDVNWRAMIGSLMLDRPVEYLPSPEEVDEYYRAQQGEAVGEAGQTEGPVAPVEADVGLEDPIPGDRVGGNELYTDPPGPQARDFVGRLAEEAEAAARLQGDQNP